MNKKIVKELEKQINLLKSSNKLLLAERDTLKNQIDTYIEIKINLEQEVSVQQKIVEDLNKNIEDYVLIESNLRAEIEGYKQKIKHKNGTITKLIITNIVTVAIIVVIVVL